MPTSDRRRELRGAIVSTGLDSGDRVVIGHWVASPVGALTDVMWCDPDGVRTLFVPDDAAAQFVGGVYEFDAVVVAPIEVTTDARRLEVRLVDRTVRVEAGRLVLPIPFRRPAWFTRFIEGPIARATLGVRTYGVSPTGVREWYRTDSWRPLRSASGELAGRMLGGMRRVEPATGFGFSEPPARPSWVRVRPLLEYPPGRSAPG